jgi:hypothetical protein
MEEIKGTNQESTGINELAKKLAVPVSVIRPMNKTELAGLYQTNLKQFNKWIKPFLEYIGEDESSIYTCAQVIRIFEKLGPLPVRKKNK